MKLRGPESFVGVLFREVRRTLERVFPSQSREAVEASTSAALATFADAEFIDDQADRLQTRRLKFAYDSTEPVSEQGGLSTALPTHKDAICVETYQDTERVSGTSLGGPPAASEAACSDERSFLEWYEGLPIGRSSGEALTVNDYAAEALEYEPALSPQLVRFTVKCRGTIPHYERALLALEPLSTRFGLSTAEVTQLVAVLGRGAFSRTIEELERLLSLGKTVDCIVSAHVIRLVWRRNEQFGSRRVRRGREGLLFESSSYCPTWKQAVVWADCIGRVADEDELEMYFGIWYDRWLSYPRNWRSSRSFVSFVGRILAKARNSSHLIPPEFSLFSEEYEQEQDGDNAERRLSKALAQEGLIPDIWTDPFDERVSIDPTFPLLDDFWPKSERKNEDDDE